MNSHLDIIKAYFNLLESFSTDRREFERVLHPEMLQTEYPNVMTKNGQERGLEGCLRGAEMGRKLLSEQKLEIKNHLENGDGIMVETIWTGTLAMDAGPLKRDQRLKAFICMVFEIKDGLIYRQRNYDCYEPF